MKPDDRLDPALEEALRGYNEPPPVPRDAIWTGIERTRRSRRAVPLPRPRWRPAVWGVAAAAILLLGIGIGRMLDHRGARSVTTPAPGAAGTVPGGAYRLAALEHFTRAEVLLTRVRTATPGTEAPAALGAWARGLLQDTRRLLDSPAGADPQLHALLEDLELVLVQIVQAQAGTGPQERAWIDDGLRERGLLDRLRLVTPETPVRTGNPGV